MDKIMSNFIWEGGKAKIPLKILQGNKEQGGLGLFNLEKKDKALKVNWVNRISHDPSLAEIANFSLNNNFGMLLWESNLETQDIKGMKITNIFWESVLKCWCELTFENPVSKDQVKEQVLWYNSGSKIKGGFYTIVIGTDAEYLRLSTY